MNLESSPRGEQNLREKYVSKADQDGFVFIGDFATIELKRQTKSIAAFADGDEGGNPDINWSALFRFQGESGNYSDVKIHIDDLEKFIMKVKEYYQE